MYHACATLINQSHLFKLWFLNFVFDNFRKMTRQSKKREVSVLITSGAKRGKINNNKDDSL